MEPKLKHYILWYDEDKGMMSKYRSSHKDMEKLVNQIINSEPYVLDSLKVIVGYEELELLTGTV